MAMRAKGQVPQSYTWNFPICPHDVAIDLAVIRALADELATADGPRQGLLLGLRQRGLTRLDALEPLTALDAALFADRVGSRPTVVGYYRIRQGCAFILDPAEIALAKAYFPDPGSVVLLVERRESGGAECTFAFWRGDAFVSNLPRPFPLDPALLAEQSPPPAMQSQPALSPLPQPAPAEPRVSVLRRNAAAIGLVVAAVLGTDILPLIWQTGKPPAEDTVQLPTSPTASPAISLVSHTAGDIQIAWDAGSLPGATAGLLKISDGGLSHHVSLDLDQLRQGSIVYTPGAGPVRAELKVLLADGEMVELPVSDRPASRVAPAQSVERPPVVQPPVVKPPVERAPVESTPVVRAPVVAAVPSPRSTPPSASAAPMQQPLVKRFEIGSVTGRAPGNSPALPDAPVVQIAPAAAPVLTASLPAPAPPSRVRLGAPVDRTVRTGSGRLIWTGSLERRGVVEFEGRSASVGSLTGSLPGVPVNVKVSPAEFGNGGLVVYTTDARLHHHVEPPSAANGWNRITYIWDPERVRQIAVLETPNPSNRFSHLALRSDSRHISLLVIDWTAQASTTQ